MTAAVKPKTSTASNAFGATKTAGATSTPASEPTIDASAQPTVNMSPDADAEQPRDLGREGGGAHAQAEARAARRAG